MEKKMRHQRRALNRANKEKFTKKWKNYMGRYSSDCDSLREAWLNLFNNTYIRR